MCPGQSIRAAVMYMCIGTCGSTLQINQIQPQMFGSEGSVCVSIFLVMRLQQHWAIFGWAFSFPLFLSPLPPPFSPGPTHPSQGRDEGGIRVGGGRVTSLCSRLFTLPLTRSLSISPSFFLSFVCYFFLLLSSSSPHIFLIPLKSPFCVSCLCSFCRSCHLVSAPVPMWAWQREVERDIERERERNRARERWPCRRGDVSSCCHWVLLQLICSLIPSLSFALLTSQ